VDELKYDEKEFNNNNNNNNIMYNNCISVKFFAHLRSYPLDQRQLAKEARSKMESKKHKHRNKSQIKEPTLTIQ
jgi:hypothetical protein